MRTAAYRSGAAVDHVERLAAVVGDLELDPEPRQQLTRDHLVGLVVFGQQHASVELALEWRVERAARRMHPCALRLDDRVQQRRRRDRLREEHVYTERGAAGFFLLARIRADQHDRQRARFAARADALGRVEPVHAGQHPVEDDEAERILASFPVAALQQSESLFGRGHRRRRNRPASQQRLQELAARLGVFDDERRPLGDASRNAASGRLGLGLDAEARGKDEGGALARRTFDRQVAAHETSQTPADHEAKSSASVLPRGRAVCLSERLEESRLLVRGNADAGVCVR